MKNKKPKRPKLNDHDTFVRNIFRKKRWAVELFKLAFLAETLEMMDFSRMICSPGAVYSYEQGHRNIDLLYTLRLRGEEQEIYILLEHTSTKKEGQLANMDEKKDAIKRQHGRNVVIYSLLFHQGNSPWPYPIKVTDYLSLPKTQRDRIQSATAGWEVTLFDLGKMSREEFDNLNICLTMRAILFTMKYIRSPILARDIHLLAEWLEGSDKYVVNHIRNYILNYLGESGKELDARLQEIANTKLGDSAMRLREILREEGREEGLNEGRKKEMDTVRNLLHNGVALDVILKSTGLSPELLRQEGILAF